MFLLATLLCCNGFVVHGTCYQCYQKLPTWSISRESDLLWSRAPQLFHMLVTWHMSTCRTCTLYKSLDLLRLHYYSASALSKRQILWAWPEMIGNKLLWPRAGPVSPFAGPWAKPGCGAPLPLCKGYWLGQPGFPHFGPGKHKSIQFPLGTSNTRNPYTMVVLGAPESINPYNIP